VDYETEIEHDGRAYHVKVPGLEVLRCESCGAVALDDAASNKVTEAFRAAAGLLRPEEIRQKREALGLTQKELAACLDISPFTVSRWETGAQVQQKVLDRVLRMFFDHPPTRAYMMQAAGVERATAAVAAGSSAS
jgi:putative zinc finger/helix-turn-helix YgiT family protein